MNRSVPTFLVIAGTGPERKSIEALANQLGIADQVRFPGYFRPTETVALYASSQVVVLPSVTWRGWKETWGLVVNEAFNQGVPVIATDAVGGAAGGLVIDGENGFIVPECDAAAIAASLDRVLNDTDLSRRFSMAARRRITAWDQPDMVNAFDEAIRFVLLQK